MKSLWASAEFDKKDSNTYILLLSAPVLLTIYWYYGNAGFLTKVLPVLNTIKHGDIVAHMLQFVSFFILMLIVPVVLVKSVFKESLTKFGFGFGDKKFGLILIGVTIPLVVVPLIYIAAGMPDIQQEYPLSKQLFDYPNWIIWYEMSYVIFYYIAWEFFFRGFLLFGFKDRFGAFNAILIQTISSCLIHIGKPDGETLGSILIGILFGIIALRTRSFWYVFILHAAIGVLTDLFVLAR